MIKIMFILRRMFFAIMSFTTIIDYSWKWEKRYMYY